MVISRVLDFLSTRETSILPTETVCEENPSWVSRAIEIKYFQNFYKVLKTCPAGQKRFFDTPKRHGLCRAALRKVWLILGKAGIGSAGPAATGAYPIIETAGVKPVSFSLAK